jgi:hypothetical protein
MRCVDEADADGNGYPLTSQTRTSGGCDASRDGLDTEHLGKFNALPNRQRARECVLDHTQDVMQRTICCVPNPKSNNGMTRVITPKSHVPAA